MTMPEQVYKVIQDELDRNKGGEKFVDINLRKDVEEEVQAHYSAAPKAKGDKVLQAWYDFHREIPCHSFQTFYSKAAFCRWIQRKHLPEDDEKAQRLFLALIADRKFLFLEYNEHLNDPEYPPMSEIVQKPDRYLKSQDQKTRNHSDLIVQQGFVPTYAHVRACEQMGENYAELTGTVARRKQHIETNKKQDAPLNKLYQSLHIHIAPFSGEPSTLEASLCCLFLNYMEEAANHAYSPEYQSLSTQPWSNYLPAIHTVLEYLERQELMPYSALIFFHLFTQYTKKLAQGKLRDYQFKPLYRQAPGIPPRQAQEITRRRTEHKIMLFDYLLKLLPSDDLDYMKFLFGQYTQYSGYFHFDVSRCQDSRFSCLPNSRDSVDQLGGMFRRHIRFCIPNDVGWLTPGLSKNRLSSSETLATLLLQDATNLPVYTRLTDRVRRLLANPARRNEMICGYQASCPSQKKTINLLNGWCSQYGLEFIGAESFLDLRPHTSETLRQLCGRFVLEYMLKEQIYNEARENLSQLAKQLFGKLCLDGETFQFP